MTFLQKPDRLHGYPSVAGGKPRYFCKNLTERMLPFLWQAWSQDIFAKTWQTACCLSCGRREAMIFLKKPDRPHAILPVAGGEPWYFCKNLTDRMLSFLWQAGSQDIFAKTCKSHHKNCQTDPLNCFCSCISSFSFPVLNQIFCKLLPYSTVFSNLWRKFIYLHFIYLFIYLFI